jgi:hypothetical protein
VLLGSEVVDLEKAAGRVMAVVRTEAVVAKEVAHE